ncbi:hypothetical protein [Streptomyces canus]|uniref:hypothetical protein n=1 Tax=Streptomyces canus TaxID=58343 RepID=UPI0033B011B0
MKVRTPNAVWVTGDQTIDWAVTPLNRHRGQVADERLHVPLRLLWHTGGVFQISSLIQAALSAASPNPPPFFRRHSIYCAKPPRQEDLTAYGSGINHSFSVLGDYPTGNGDSIHRVAQFIGFHPDREQVNPGTTEYTPIKQIKKAKVIVIDDANLGFRDRRENWGPIIDYLSEHSTSPPWVVWKISYDVGDGHKREDFRTELVELAQHSNLRERLITLTAAARLRDAGAEISRDLSWDQSVNDVLYELDNRNEFSTLRNSPCLIVSFGPSGAMLIEHQASKTNWNLVYNRKIMEREWMNTHHQGMMFGYGSALCSTIVSELVAIPEASTTPPKPQYVNAIKRALVAMQQMYERGFKAEQGSDRFDLPSGIFDEEGQRKLLKDINTHPGEAPRPVTDRETCDSILADPPTDLTDHESKLFNIARKGKEALEDGDTPIAEYGKLVTADRTEVESLRAIYSLIDNYCGPSKPTFDSKPLAIAVFGSPGSGKGFTVKQVAQEWVKSRRLKPLEFKLSELGSPSELVGALDQIRDVALGGQVPLAIWDEFDSPLDGGGKLGWLRYFLGPIQDGKFQQEEATHLIGPAIFVFAGGTSSSYEEFSTQGLDEDARKSMKVPDFLSRLRGYIDIPGVDTTEVHDSPEPKLMLRRALILNSLFDDEKIGRLPSGEFDVDDGVLEAFLRVSRYRHGVRSMQAIIQMRKTPKYARFDRSSLPSHDQLKLHVEDANEFFGIMRAHENTS